MIVLFVHITIERLLIENERFPRYKFYSCYSRSVKKLLKYFVLFQFHPITRNDFWKFSHDAICPTKGSPNTAGYDLYSVENDVVPPSSVRAISTNIGFKIPQGYFGKTNARSGFAMQFTDFGGGVIDVDYRGPVVILFFNISNIHFEERKGSLI